jgi:Tol biopolymer transport system component
MVAVTASADAQKVGRRRDQVEAPRGRWRVTAIAGTELQGLLSVSPRVQSPSTARRVTSDQPTNRSSPAASLHGRFLFHRYTNYDAWNGRLFLYDFGTKQVSCVSERWGIDHAINGNFSPDGRFIVFMGVSPGQHRGGAWDVYLWKVDGRERPINLTADLGTRDEDPRFARDGQRILFKQDGEIRMMDLRTRQISSLPFGGAKAERSMPLLTSDGKQVVYAEGAGKDMDIFLIDLKSGTRRPLAIEPEVQEYFPVRLDATRFFYVRWTSRTDHHDQIWVGALDGRTRGPLRFNQPGSDASDPYPIDDRLVFFSSTRPGGRGGYDLYLGDREDGASWSLDSPGINTAHEELGASYARGAVKK